MPGSGPADTLPSAVMERRKDMVLIIVIYAVLINLVAFTMFWMDKKRAKAKKWRIPEKTLFVCATLGGSIGAIIGMWLFRHKTKHWYFVYGMPAILAVQLLVVWIAVWGI